MTYSFRVLKAIILIFFFFTNAFASEIFAPPIYTTDGELPTSWGLVAGDFNSDGKVDLVTGNQWLYPGIYVHLGNGDGTFQSRQKNSGSTLWEFISEDFNKDGTIDLATAPVWNTFSLHSGRGDGTFQLAQTGAGLPSEAPHGIASGDFNNDGKIDLAFTSYWQTSSFSILLGNGDGTFQLGSSYEVEYLASDVSTGDFNGDGILDLVIGNVLSDTVSIFLGNGDGTFQQYSNYIVGYYPPYSPRKVVTSDFNGDGKDDIVAMSGNDSISVLIGNGDGTFQPAVSYSTAIYSYSITTGDFNEDRKIDIAVTWESGISLFLGNGDGTFQQRIDYGTGGYAPVDVVTADFNGDGKPDIAVVHRYGDVAVLLNIHKRPPIANAGPDQTVECAGPSGASVTLDGSGSSDPDGDPLTYTWTWSGGSAAGVNPTVSLPLGTTVVTLTVSDGKATATDTVSITVRDTTPPVTTATGGNGDWYNTNVISTFTAYDICSGAKEVHYVVDGSETVTPGSYAATTLANDGIHSISYFTVDNAGNAEAPKAMTVKIDKTPPTVSLNANPNIIWPLSHKMVNVLIGGNATDALSGLASVVFLIEDEYGAVEPSLNGFNTTVTLEAWREGTDEDGRRYTITATATDAAGNKSIATTEVLVPHDQR